MEFNRIIENITENYPQVFYQLINTEDVVFEERAKMNCFYCAKYNVSWKCPPKLPENVDYKKMINEYDNAAFVYLNLEYNLNNYQEIRNDSTIQLHRALLAMEKLLWDNNEPMAISFIGGSCKLCKNGCGKERCNNPQLSRVPLEGIGVNVIKSAEKYGITINFPPQKSILRLGLLLW